MMPNRLLSASEARNILSSTARQIIFWLFIVVGALLLYKFLVNPAGKNTSPLSYSELVAKIQNNEISSMMVKQSEVVAVEKNTNKEYRTQLDNEFVKRDLMNMAVEKDPNTGKARDVKVEAEGGGSLIWPVLLSWAPILFT